ncbi:MAG: hypothetical protein ACK58T_01820, partial [Phycisphaerae bacterium]
MVLESRLSRPAGDTLSRKSEKRVRFPLPSQNKTSTPEDSQPAPKQETGTARLFGYGCATFFLLPFALAGTAVLYLG